MEIIVFLSVAIAVLAVLTSIFLVRRVKKQIAEMTDALVDVKNGNGNRRILSATNELVSPLAYEINEIVVSYESRLSIVRQTEETNRQLMLFERLYEDNVSGKIDDARFAKISKRYEQEQGENAKKIKALRLELKKDESKRMDIDDFLETVRRYTDATTITKRMVAELIDHIEVYHAEKQDGITNQRVVIYYNCIGAFDVPDRRKIPEADIIMETRKGIALSYAPEQVAV